MTPNINLKFLLNENTGKLIVSRPQNGPKARASGYTRQEHFWGAEINLLYLIQQQLKKAGIILARKKISKDQFFAHLFGDDYMCYLRTNAKFISSKTMPHFFIYDGDYAVRNSAEHYNRGENVSFLVVGDIFQIADHPPRQPNWHYLLKNLCDKAGIECDIQKLAA